MIQLPWHLLIPILLTIALACWWWIEGEEHGHDFNITTMILIPAITLISWLVYAGIFWF